jgi:aspartyl protease family protein
MRRVLVALLIVAATAAQAASLDPEHSAAIDQATKEFLAKAAEAKKTGTVPREADPGIKPLLDTVFDTNPLSHGPLPYADLEPLDHWADKIGDVGAVYVLASRPTGDAGLFGPEMERYFAAAVAVLRALADCAIAEVDAQSGKQVPPDETRRLDKLRGEIVRKLEKAVVSLRDRGLTGGAIQARALALTAAGPSFARLLKPAEIERLRQTAMTVAAQLREKSLRLALSSFAVALTEPRAPIATASLPASAEIALEHEGRGYMVTGRINGATTVKFVVDSGATYVALPQDVVDDMVKAGTVTDADMRGRATFVIANGKRHRAMQLMLRQLEVGGHVVTNVMANVVPAHAHALLGLSFLGKFKSWTLDNQRHVLVVSE